MARKALTKEVVVSLIVGAGQASPSPPVGPALGSKGVKSMDFCKEFNARTAQYITGTPIPARVTVRPDRTFSFELRTPTTSSLLFAAARVSLVKNRVRGAGNVPGPRKNKDLQFAAGALVTAGGEAAAQITAKGKGTETAGNSGMGIVGAVSLKHVYEIARIKQRETRLSGLSLEGLCRCVVAQAGSCGIVVVP